jgi:hypothetical protein
MAIFYPSLEKINQFKVQPTEGERTLLKFLKNSLDDSFEVYFNPFLNGDRPDVLIMRKGYGVMIIEVKDWKFSSLSKYKYANLFKTLDLLTLMFSSKLRIGLKELQVTMQYPNVQEFEGDVSKNVSVYDIDNVKKYNINDIDSTDELLTRLTKDIELRIAIEDEYKIDALNKDGVNLGMEIIKQRYLSETGLQ